MKIYQPLTAHLVQFRRKGSTVNAEVHRKFALRHANVEFGAAVLCRQAAPVAESYGVSTRGSFPVS